MGQNKGQNVSLQVEAGLGLIPQVAVQHESHHIVTPFETRGRAALYTPVAFFGPAGCILLHEEVPTGLEHLCPKASYQKPLHFNTHCNRGWVLPPGEGHLGGLASKYSLRE